LALCLFSTLLINRAPVQNNFIKEVNTNTATPMQQPVAPVSPAPINNK